jgi:hypothetical protein
MLSSSYLNATETLLRLIDFYKNVSFDPIGLILLRSELCKEAKKPYTGGSRKGGSGSIYAVNPSTVIRCGEEAHIQECGLNTPQPTVL